MVSPTYDELSQKYPCFLSLVPDTLCLVVVGTHHPQIMMMVSPASSSHKNILLYHDLLYIIHSFQPYLEIVMMMVMPPTHSCKGIPVSQFCA